MYVVVHYVYIVQVNDIRIMFCHTINKEHYNPSDIFFKQFLVKFTM